MHNGECYTCKMLNGVNITDADIQIKHIICDHLLVKDNTRLFSEMACIGVDKCLLVDGGSASEQHLCLGARVEKSG